MIATATFLSLLGADPGSEGDVESLAASLYVGEEMEIADNVEGVDLLARRARELGEIDGAHLEVIWLGDIDTEGFTVGGLPLAEFWLEGGGLASVRIRSINLEGETLGGFTIVPVGSGILEGPIWKQVSPTDDVGFMQLDSLNPIEFEDGTRMDPSEYGTELYPGIMGSAWAPVVGVAEWTIDDGSGQMIGSVMAITPNAHMDGRPLRSINGFRRGFEYWRWTGISWPSSFELKRCLVGGNSLQGGPWEVHDDLGFAGTGSSPSGVTTSGTWYEITGGAAGRGNPLGAWLGRKTSAYGLAMTPRNSGTPYMSHDIAELHFMAEPSALFNGRLASDPIEPFVFTAVSPPAGAAHYIWSGNLPQFP